MSVEQVENAASAIAIPFTYGNVAIQIGKQKVGTANEHSHKWTMFLRGAANQDLSYAVSKVVFTLHPDFANHIREVTKPPYIVQETGWGSFEVAIAVHFHDASIPPLRLMHILKLFHDVPSVGPDKPVVAETYDEIVFNELPADPAYRAALQKGPVVDPPPYPHGEHLGLFSADADLIAIRAARQFILDRLEEQEDRLSKARASAAVLKKQLPQLGVLF